MQKLDRLLECTCTDAVAPLQQHSHWYPLYEFGSEVLLLVLPRTPGAAAAG